MAERMHGETANSRHRDSTPSPRGRARITVPPLAHAVSAIRTLYCAFRHIPVAPVVAPGS